MPIKFPGTESRNKTQNYASHVTRRPGFPKFPKYQKIKSVIPMNQFIGTPNCRTNELVPWYDTFDIFEILEMLETPVTWPVFC